MINVKASECKGGAAKGGGSLADKVADALKRKQSGS